MTHPTRVQVRGPLREHAPGFCNELKSKGYTPLSAANQVRLLAHVSRWLEGLDLEPKDLTERRVEQFLRARRKAGYKSWRTQRGLVPLLEYLRRLMVVPPPSTSSVNTPLQHLLETYADYLQRERGLTFVTVRHRRQVAERFLREHAMATKGDLEQLTADDVRRFVLRRSRGLSVRFAKGLVTALRSLLSFLHLEGHLSKSLAAAAPAIASWRLTSLPQALDSDQVERLICSCDRRRSVGLRDHAVLLLLARLGLRRGEVAALETRDIDWRRGEILVRGKGHRRDSLPLPADVGEALVAYLRRGRSQVDCRKVFLRQRAPQGPIQPSAITEIVRQACLRAGLPPVGAHRLRHSAATLMLRRGSSLAEIAQVLRHRSIMTTAIYAKVDRDALRTLAQRWPGGDV